MKAKSATEIQLATNVSKTKVNIGGLKTFAMQQLPRDWPLRELLLAESDELEISIFLARLPIWVQLSNFKRSPR